MKMPALRVRGEGMDRDQDAGAHQEGAQQAQGKREDGQQQRPAFEQAALVRRRQGMNQCGADPTTGMKDAFSTGSQNQ